MSYSFRISNRTAPGFGMFKKYTSQMYLIQQDEDEGQKSVVF